MTFSIVAHCARTGQLGVAVSTAVPAVGAMCPYVKAGVGAVSTQSWVNPYLAIEALDLMQQGRSGPDALSAVIEKDAAKDLRQIGVVDAQGRAASWSGQHCTEWFGHIVEAHFAAQGNMLVGEARWRPPFVATHRSISRNGCCWRWRRGSAPAATSAVDNPLR
jgi:uncharacterized Ntn-hydrolase superfamily protein